MDKTHRGLAELCTHPGISRKSPHRHGWRGKILLDDHVFGDEFVPERLAGREAEVREMYEHLCPLKQGGAARNLFVFGPPGSGKTLACRWLLKEHFTRNSAYVNCWSRRTAHKVMEDVLRQIDCLRNDRESTTEFIDRLTESGRKLIVCLDECDQLRDRRILYDLARNGCSLVLISNSPDMLKEIDRRIRSSLFLKEVEFKPYGRQEIGAIVRDRLLQVSGGDVIGGDLLAAVSEICDGDARIGLRIISAAIREAECKDLPEITIEQIRNVSKSVRKYRLPYLLSKLNEHQRAVYAILKKVGSMKSGGLYAEYCKAVKEPVVDRAYRKHMERLEELGLVKSSGSGRWKRYEIL